MSCCVEIRNEQSLHWSYASGIIEIICFHPIIDANLLFFGLINIWNFPKVELPFPILFSSPHNNPPPTKRKGKQGCYQKLCHLQYKVNATLPMSPSSNGTSTSHKCGKRVSSLVQNPWEHVYFTIKKIWMRIFLLGH